MNAGILDDDGTMFDPRTMEAKEGGGLRANRKVVDDDAASLVRRGVGHPAVPRARVLPASVGQVDP